MIPGLNTLLGGGDEEPAQRYYDTMTLNYTFGLEDVLQDEAFHILVALAVTVGAVNLFTRKKQI
jgi:hypothetical protein